MTIANSSRPLPPEDSPAATGTSKAADIERRMLEQREMYQQILDAISDMVLVKGEKSRIVWANRAFRDYYGMSNEQLRDIIDAAFNEPDYTQQYIKDDLEVFTTGQTLNIPEEPVTRHDGTVRIFHTVKSPILGLDSKVQMTVGVSRDITDQKRVQQELARYQHHLETLVEERTAELRELTENFRILLSSLAEGVVSAGSDGDVRFLNPAAERLTGWTDAEAKGRHLSEVLTVLDEQTQEPLPLHPDKLSARAGKASLTAVVCSRTDLRRLVALRVSGLRSEQGVPQGLVIVLRDVTVERELEDQRLRHQKIESVGLLAGGIAHDFNNILTGILGNISIARIQIPPGTQSATALDSAERACVRAQALTRQLLTFAKGGAPLKKLLRIEDTVREAAILALRGSSVKLSLRVSPDIHAVEADEGQIVQVVNNLALNSKQAMPQGGEITIVIDNAAVSDKDGLPLTPGAYVCVAVRDTGVGIPPEQLPKVFDPYFTTKELGSGLGLASAHSIIHRHGGHISAVSNPGHGACFTFWLPAVPESQHLASEGLAETAPLGAKSLLILDDEKMVRDVLCQMLEMLGHRAIAASTSQEAFEAFDSARGSGAPFDAIFVDLTMPGDLSGESVIQVLRERDREAKVIVMSGYSNNPVMANYRELGLQGALSKPFTLDVVKEILAQC